MKRILSIVLAVLLLASGLHLSVASHYCGGTLAQVKWSLNHDLAGCGMENDVKTHSGNPEWQDACCQDLLSAWTTDGQFTASTPLIAAFNLQPITCFNTVSLSSVETQTVMVSSFIFPPGNLQPSRVCRNSICVYRI